MFLHAINVQQPFMLYNASAHACKTIQKIGVKCTCKVILNVYMSQHYVGSLSKAQVQDKEWIAFLRALDPEGGQKLSPEFTSALS